MVAGGPPFKFHLGLGQKMGVDGVGIDAFDAVRVLNQLKGYDIEATKKVEKTARSLKLKDRIFGFFRKGDKK